MNLNPIFVTLFDHDGWPLCPRCNCLLRATTVVKGEDFKWAVPLMMKVPLLCENCNWRTPESLETKHAFNLVECQVVGTIHWEIQGPHLPRIKVTRYIFDRDPANEKLDQWAMWFGVN